MTFELDLKNRAEQLLYHVLVRRAHTRVSEDPLVNKPSWFLLLKTEEATRGFIVSYRLTLYHSPNLITIAVVGVNRAEAIST